MADLDEHLMPKNSPYNTREPYVPAFDFDVTHQIPTGGINYTNLTASSRAATAVISLSGEKGTFKDIQAAINYVNSLGGGRILVLPGTYTITVPITIYSDIRLEGLSRDDCIFDFNNTSNNISVSGDPRPVNIRIFTLTLKNCANITATIDLENASTAEVNDCAFVDNISTGYDIACGNAGQLRIRDCISTDCGGFFSNSGIGGVGEVSNNSITRPQGYVFFGDTSASVNGGAQTDYRHNYVSGATKAIIKGKFTFTNFLDNIFSNSDTSTDPVIDITDTVFCNFNHNDVVANAGSVLIINSGTVDCKFIGNRFSGSATSVVTLTSATRMHFTSNRILTGAANNPVMLLTGSSECFINGCSIGAINGSTGQDGVKLVSTNQTVITGNWILGSTGVGPAYGVNISNAGSDDNVVVANILIALTANTQDNGANNIIASNS